jgi:hypothetical protein
VTPVNHVYTFGSFKLGAGKSVTLHTGKGINTVSHFYWVRGWYVLARAQEPTGPQER